jgi:creatinine amidohydrolase
MRDEKPSCAHGVATAGPTAESVAPRVLARTTDPGRDALKTVFLEEMTSQELAAALAAGHRTVLIYSGSVEASGPHLALGKHNWRVRAYAERVARALGDAVVAPIIPVAPNPPELLRFPGTIGLRPETFTAVNEDVARSMVAAGFRCVVLLGDHESSQRPLSTLATRLDSEFRTQGIRVCFSSDAYAKSTEEIVAYGKAHGLRAGGHGGLWDTSELWAVEPDAVRPQFFASGDTDRGDSGGPGSPAPQAGKVLTGVRVRNAVARVRALFARAKKEQQGVWGDPRHSSRQLGQIFCDIRVRNAVTEIRALRGEARTEQ